MKVDRTLLRRVVHWLLQRSAPVLALLLLLLVYFMGIRTERSGFVEQVLDPGLKRITRPVLNAFRGGVPQVDQAELILSDSAWNQLEARLAQRNDAPADSSLDTLALAGMLRWNNDTFHVAVRPAMVRSGMPVNTAALIVEGLSEPLPAGTLSYHVEPAPPGQVLYPWLFARALQRAALPHFPVQLAELSAQGEDKGLYLWRSSQPVLSNSGSGVVWGGYDASLWERAHHAGTTEDMDQAHLPQGSWAVAPLRIQGTPVDGVPPRAWTQGLRALQAPRSSGTSAMEPHRTGALLALSELFGAQAELRWQQLHFTLQPASNKLLPISPGRAAGSRITTLLPLLPMDQQNEWVTRMLADTSVRAAYHGWLERITFGGWSDSLWSELQPAANELKNYLRTDPGLTSFDSTAFAHNQRTIQRILAPPDPAVAFLRPGGASVRVASLHPLPLELLALVTSTDTVPLRPLQAMPGHAPESPLAYVDLPIKQVMTAPTKVLMRVPGTTRVLSVHIRESSSLNAWQGM
jgi:hypothetical protein